MTSAVLEQPPIYHNVTIMPEFSSSDSLEKLERFEKRTTAQWTSEKVSFDFKSSFKEDNLSFGIHKLKLPDRFAREGVMQPSHSCRKLAAEFAKRLLSKYDLYPERFAASVEEGVALVYQNYRSNTTLFIEVFNCLEIAALLNRDKTILGSWDVKNELGKEFSEIVRRFQED